MLTASSPALMIRRLRPAAVVGCLALVLGAQALGLRGADTADTVSLVSLRRIWDQGPHSAFGDLIRFRGAWYCTFREASRHHFYDGSVRVIRSDDGETWESVALITDAAADLRDPKLSVTPDGQLMIAGLQRFPADQKRPHQSLAWFSLDGVQWSEKHEIGDPDYWLWRVAWHRGTAYTMGYSVGKEANQPGSIRVYSSRDGKSFTTLADRVLEGNYPNEAMVVFAGDTAYCLMRRDGAPLHQDPKSGLLGISKPPYTQWEWKDVGCRVGGPNLLVTPGGRLLAAVRLYETDNWHPARTAVGWIDPVTGRFSEALRIPSGGDNAYASLVFHDSLVWMTYYSSHEGKTAIYLAKLRLPNGS